MGSTGWSYYPPKQAQVLLAEERGHTFIHLFTPSFVRPTDSKMSDPICTAEDNTVKDPMHSTGGAKKQKREKRKSK